MRHESIFVVYDSCQATAEEIADKLDQGKGVAMLVFNGENTKDNWIVENICKDLRRSGAHMPVKVSMPLTTVSNRCRN